jgi:hypothetical protein
MVLISMNTAQPILQWSGPGVLQSAPNVSGPFTDVIGCQGNSFTNTDVSGAARFFRLRR